MKKQVFMLVATEIGFWCPSMWDWSWDIRWQTRCLS